MWFRSRSRRGIRTLRAAGCGLRAADEQITRAMPVYTKADFDRWYRSRSRVRSPADLGRPAALAVAFAERVLRRRIRSVLDIGAGEGAWRGALRAIRPRVRYVGVEPSEYAVRRYGERRGIIAGSLGEIGLLDLRGPFDLVICADLLHYLPDDEIVRGLRAVKSLASGPLFAPVMTGRDNPTGDLRGFRRRTKARYQQLMRRGGFVSCGLHAWVLAQLREDLDDMELV